MDAGDMVEVRTGTDAPVGSVIWLHGLGADGHDFEPIVPELDWPEDRPLRFVFPHAPLRPVTVNGGMTMRAWYDIYSFDRGGPVDEQGINESAGRLDALIDREVARGVEVSRIVVAGFSQGGAIALFASLRRAERLGGLMALSTWLPLADRFRREFAGGRVPPGRDTPVFVAHGSHDPLVPVEFGRSSAALLRDCGFHVEWHEYPMAHSVCAREIADIRAWLLSVYARSNA